MVNLQLVSCKEVSESVLLAAPRDFLVHAQAMGAEDDKPEEADKTIAKGTTGARQDIQASCTVGAPSDRIAYCVFEGWDLD